MVNKINKKEKYSNERWRQYNRAYYRYRQTGNCDLLKKYYVKYGSYDKFRGELPPAYERAKKQKKQNNKQKIREYNKTYAILRRHNDPNPLNEWREKYKKVKL